MNRNTKDDDLQVRPACVKRHVTRRLWSEDERKIMNEMFADNYTETICQILNRSYT